MKAWRSWYFETKKEYKNHMAEPQKTIELHEKQIKEIEKQI